jgi:signal peptidase I
MDPETQTQMQTVSRPWWFRLVLGRDPRRTVLRSILWILLAFFLFKYVLVPVRVQGISMQPTYQSGRVNFINRWAYLRHPPRRGDVVGIQYAGHQVMLFKRIIGLPGERIAIHRGIVHIDGEPLPEPYVKWFNNHWERAEEKLAPDTYFVIGDNRGMSIHEHVMGRAEANRIVGKALF